MAKKLKGDSPRIVTTGGAGFIPASPDVLQLLKLELKKHPDRTEDILYRIISQGNKDGTKYDRNILDIILGVYDSVTNKPMEDDRYTGSWTWAEDGLKPNPDRDWNLLFAKGNVKGLYQEIPKEELRGINLDLKYPSYFGNFVPKRNYMITEEYSPLLLYLANHNLGGQVYEENNEGGNTGIVRLPFSETEYLDAVKNKYTVDNVGRFNASIGIDPAGNPEVLFYDFGNFGKEYGNTYGGSNAGLYGELLDTFGHPFHLRLYVPINAISTELFNLLPEDSKWEVEDMNRALLDIAEANKVPVMQYSPSTDTYETVHLPEIIVNGNKKAEGGSLDTPPDWNELSMREKAAYIRMGVANGFKDIDSIKLVYNEFKKGGPKLTASQSYIYEELPRLLREAGLDVKVTSGYRPVGAAGTAGNRSWHPRHGAVDIVPLGNTTFEDIEYALHNNPVIRLYMLSNNFGLLDESGRTPESRTTMHRTGATGPHFHIGRDSKPAALYRQRVGTMYPSGDGKSVHFTNPFMPLPLPEQPKEPMVIQPLDIDVPISSLIPELNIVIQEQPTILGEELPEIIVTPERKTQIRPDVMLALMNSMITPYTPIDYSAQKPASATDILALINKDRVTLLLRDLEDSIIRNSLLDIQDSNRLKRDVQDIRFYRNMAANGGNLFPIGGPMITVNPGDRVDTDLCAAWSNGVLRDNGYLISGNAWSLNDVDNIFNGYDGLNRPENYNLPQVEQYNYAAADNVFKNFNSKNLDTSRPYVVNMFYNDSPSLEEAYNEGDGVTGTHTGLLTYDEPTKKWWVTHNIHGNIHLEPFVSLLNGKGKYGVTAIYAPRKNTVWNKFRGFFGFDNGGPLNIYQTGGPKGRLNVTNLSTWDEMAALVPFYYTLGKLLDPTGVTRYADTKEAISEYDANPTLSTGYNAVMETLGSLPLINKAGKAIKVVLGLVNGLGVLNDWNHAKEMQDAYNKELVIDYWDNTVKSRGEASKHNEQMKKKMSYTDVNHLPSFELAPRGAKIGLVLPNYSINHRVVSRYKK